MKNLQIYTYPIIFFDSTCILCNSSVQFILRHEHSSLSHFAPLHGIIFSELYTSSITEIPDSILVYKNGVFLSKTEAIIAIMIAMGFYWKYLASLLWLIPPFLRNAIYDLIAANRIQWFGRQESCLLPNKENSHRFHS
ncbi:MAG: thiol-disulfide oxidoreductase DCC family protein [Bacteroidota bacterium]|jgi:predicted DCC family thiol-disulfide oxidoreductase YuxK